MTLLEHRTTINLNEYKFDFFSIISRNVFVFPVFENCYILKFCDDALHAKQMEIRDFPWIGSRVKPFKMESSRSLYIQITIIYCLGTNLKTRIIQLCFAL